MIAAIERETLRAYLAGDAGAGLLVMPSATGDVEHDSAAWDATVRELAALGWEPLADDDGAPAIEGTRSDGRDVVALYQLDHGTAESAELAGAYAALRAAAGLTLGADPAI